MTDRQTYDGKLNSLKAERLHYEADWRQIAEWFLPRIPRSLQGNVTPNAPRRNPKIIDSTPLYARRTLVAGLMGGYTTPSKPWFRFATPDPELMEFASVREWLYKVEGIIRNIFNRSNFYNVLPFIYDNASTYGTGSALILEDMETTIRLEPLITGSYCLGQNEKYVTDTMYREVKYRVGQLVRMFGEENLTARTLQMYKNKQLQQIIDVVHLIEPNDGRDYSKVDNRNMPWRSVWYEKGGNEKEKYLRRSGFHEYPGITFCWDKDEPNDAYGVGIALDYLGDAKALQFQQKRKAQAIDKQVDPPMSAPTALKDSPVFNMPGGVTTVDVATGAQGIKPLYEVRPEMRGLLDDISETQARINSGYYVDLFLMVASDDRADRATAREIAEGHEEKLVMLGPTLERLNNGVLRPGIDRTFYMAARAGKLPPPPRELANVDLKIEYISVLAQAQKMVDIGGIERLVAFAGGAAQYEPSVLDKIDFDQTVDEYADRVGIPPGIVRSDDKVLEIRQQKALQLEQARQAAELEPRAKAAKDLSQANLDEDNALTAVIGRKGQEVAAA